MEKTHTNRLAKETSPYLLQHAHNPVDWHPWGEEALELARTEGKPIFLSIGYSACHWCHVMAHESFEDEATAELMNRHFVNIKVDREERPDLDNIYQMAYQLMAGKGGGWPLSMFLTPDLGPFWGGTYYPDAPRYGMPSFREVLMGVAHHYETKPEDVAHNVTALVGGLATANAAQPSGKAVSSELLSAATSRLVQAFDAEWGGFGKAPKFPSTMALELLLRRWYHTGDSMCLQVVEHSLKKMAEGGIYDHLGGGFARYSVDEKWLVPHFEKMLYDNALLVPLYIDAHLATGNERFADVAKETLAYVMREMTDPEGGFYAAQDADSEGEEGLFFIWRPGEIEEVIGADAAPLFMSYYGVSETGNFEGQNILWTPEPLADVAAELGITEEAAAKKLAEARARLFDRREERIHPGLDSKVITAWNGLMVSAFARAYQVFGDDKYRDAAMRAAEFLTTKLDTKDGLKRCYAGGTARHTACLDDYAFLARGLLDLHLATGEGKWFDAAKDLMQRVLDRFSSGKNGFYFTGDDHEELVARPMSGMDQSVPSGNAVAAQTLVRLHHLTGEASWLAAAENTVRAFMDPALEQPLGYAALLIAMEELLHPQRTVALVGKADDPEARDWRARLSRRYLPDTVVQQVQAGSASLPPWLVGKKAVDGGATAYVCTAGTCQPPVTDWESLDAML